MHQNVTEISDFKQHCPRLKLKSDIIVHVSLETVRIVKSDVLMFHFSQLRMVQLCVFLVYSTESSQLFDNLKGLARAHSASSTMMLLPDCIHAFVSFRYSTRCDVVRMQRPVFSETQRYNFRRPFVQMLSSS